MGFVVTSTVSLSRTSFASSQRRFLQCSESSELRPPNQLFDLATVRRSHANAEQLPWCRGTERRPHAAIPGRGPALHPVGCQNAVLIVELRPHCVRTKFS